MPFHKRENIFVRRHFFKKFLYGRKGMNNKVIQLQKGMQTAFVDHLAVSNLAYKPQFISNNYREGRKVISSIEDELLSCDSFAISVAFITMSGITPLLQTLRELEKREFQVRF